MSSLTIASYEIRRLLREPALPVLLVLLLGLSGYAAWNGASWVQKREAAIELIKAEDQARLTDMRRFIVQAYPSVILPVTQPVLQPKAMAPVSIGQADAYPFTAQTMPLGDYTTLFGRVWADIGNPAVHAAGRFDLAFVIVFLLPLVLLAGTYDLWSRERDDGIAAIVLSQPVSIGPLIAVKALARGLVVLIPSTIIILASAAWVGAREPMGLVALGLVLLVYGGFWLAVALIINVLTRRSTESAVAAGAVWLLVVVMAPSLTLATIDVVAPAASEMRFATELKARKTEIAQRQGLHRKTTPTPVRNLAPRIPDSLRDLYDDKIALDNEIMPMIAAHQEMKDARRHLLDRVRFFLPSVAVQDALDRIAGSDAGRALDFERRVREAQLKLRETFKSYLDRDAFVTEAEYDKASGFHFRDTGTTFQAGVVADLVALFISSLLILIAARAFLGRAKTP
jgi:ABC-2 type transport system permease protein